MEPRLFKIYRDFLGCRFNRSTLFTLFLAGWQVYGRADCRSPGRNKVHKGFLCLWEAQWASPKAGRSYRGWILQADQMHLLPVFSCPPTHPCWTNFHLGPSPADDRQGSSHCSSDKHWVAPGHPTVPARVTFWVTNLDTDAINSNLQPKYLCGFVPKANVCPKAVSC